MSRTAAVNSIHRTSTWVRGKPEKTRFVSFDVCFHGLSYGATSLNHSVHMRKHLGPFFDSISIKAPDFYRRDESTPLEDFVKKHLLFIEQRIIAEGPKTIAAFYADPCGWPDGFQQ